MSDPLEVVDLTRPHGFLVWRGKQQAIASPVPLPIGEVMITSDGEAFGIATLGQPSQMALSEFEREEGKHCIRPQERQMLWPTADLFYLHAIKNWQGFSEPQPIVAYEPTPDEATIIEKAKRLPKTIILDSEAVLLTGESFVIVDGLKSTELSVCLETTFGTLESNNGDKALPLYQLALVRRPTLRFEDVKKKEELMENIKEESSVDGEKRSLQELHQIQERFVVKFCRDDYNYRDNPWPVDITDDSKVIVNWRGSLHEVPFTRAESGEIVFSPQSQWTPVTTQYVSGAAKTTTETDIEPSTKTGRRLASGWVQKLKDAKDAIQELFTWAEYADQVEEEESMADMLKGDSGVAVKMVSGEPWHLSWSSNAFQDRDEEIFSLKSLEQYVQENEENEVKGWFNLWHIKGTDFAEKRYQAIIGKFLFEAGPYLKDEKGRKALEFFKQYSAGHPEIAPEGWGASVEYKYLPEERKQKLYQWTWITRTSTLARGAAANIWTKSTQQEFAMNDEQKKAAVAMFGEEFTNQLISQGTQKTKELEEAGVANKQVTELEKPAEAAPVPEPVPAEAQPQADPAADPAQLVQELAVTMQANLNEAIAPVLSNLQQQMTAQSEQIKALSDELKQVKGDQALKTAVEMPRFTFDLIRASQANSTVVPEGDALKDKKPTEVAPVNDGGSVASNYFLSAKR